MRAVVVALGKIGLPIAAQIARAGHEVVGCDIDPRVVEQVNAAQEPYPGEAGLQEALEEVVSAGRLRATTDTTAAVGEGADLVIAVPPLVVDAEARPDFSILDAVIADIGRGLRPGTVVCVETTLPVGTTRGRVAPRLAEASGLTSEQDFFTIHSPERVYAGRIFQDLATYPKLVGGLSDAGERRGIELYRSFLPAEVRAMGSAEAAELTKLAETTFRDVNIALANEFARFADRVGVDVHKVIDAANSQPFSHIHRPGVAVGGHCIPVYPRLYMAGDGDAQLPAAARAVNEGMPAYAVSLLGADLELSGARVLILGVSYRGAVKESAFSGAFGLRDELHRQGATVLASDPLYSDDELRELGFEPWDGAPVDGAIVQADHPEYSALSPGDIPGARVLVDGRAVVREGPWIAAGIPVTRIGQPRTEFDEAAQRLIQQPGAPGART
jgi:nucleotide sugar dehydrogenase